MALAPEQSVLGLRRHFTRPGSSGVEGIEWERRDARLIDHRDGSVAFEQTDVEVPSTWSVNATNILAQKYFRGTLGTAERESSLAQVVERIVGTIARWGLTDGYFAGRGLRSGREASCRVHGGGFAGTIQVMLPEPEVAHYRSYVESLLGERCVTELTVRSTGAIVW